MVSPLWFIEVAISEKHGVVAACFCCSKTILKLVLFSAHEDIN